MKYLLPLALLLSSCAKPDHTIRLGDALEHTQVSDTASVTDDQWSASRPQHSEPPPGMLVVPPRGSFGYEGCGRFAIWVFLADGKSYRIDSEHSPKTVQDMQKLLDWLNSGPTDIIKYESKDCGSSV